MKASHLILTTFLLFSVPVSYASQAETVVASGTQATASQATWANVNNIHFTDNFSLFNSGVAKLPLGKPIEVSANIAFSGDIESIKQAVVTFENVGQGIQIDYDQIIQFNENQKQAQFKFFITLTEPVPNGETRLFTVKVSDSSPGDNKYLTPYSQRQTVIEDKSFASQDSTPPVSSESTTELSSESSTEPTTETNTKPSLEESTEPTTLPSTESDTASSSKPTSDSNTKPSSEEGTKSTTEQSTKPSSEPSPPQSTGTSSTTTIESTTASSSTLNKKEGISQSRKASKVDQSSSSQSITIDNSKTHSLKTLNRSNRSSMYKILPKTGENTSDRLLVFGGILSFLSATLILIKRKN